MTVEAKERVDDRDNIHVDYAGLRGQEIVLVQHYRSSSQYCESTGNEAMGINETVGGKYLLKTYWWFLVFCSITYQYAWGMEAWNEFSALSLSSLLWFLPPPIASSVEFFFNSANKKALAVTEKYHSYHPPCHGDEGHWQESGRLWVLIHPFSVLTPEYQPHKIKASPRPQFPPTKWG